MNIFYLNKAPKICAEQHCDKHVVKMIVEYAQLLSTAHRVIDGEEYEDRSKNNRKIKRWKLSNPNKDEIIYKACHVSHPSAIWVRKSSQHYLWLFSLFTELSKEYTQRYGKTHSTFRVLGELLSEVPTNLADNGFAEPPPAMKHFPDCIVQGDSIQSYQKYYVVAKQYFAKWTNRNIPTWYSDRVSQTV